MSDPFDISGKRILVTGASSGLGRHFAQTLAAKGAAVALAARRLEKLDDLVAAIGHSGGRAAAVKLDVTDWESCQAAVAATREALGGLDLLVNNAGMAGGGAAMTLERSDWSSIMATNLDGAWNMAQAAGQAMKEAGGGAIVNIASVLGLRVSGGVLPYAVSKAGLVQMTKALALEWARYSIRVNALAPGYIETDLNRDFFESPAGEALVKRIPQRRLGQVGDLDGPLLLLASDASRFMTGSVVAVDGGHLVSGL